MPLSQFKCSICGASAPSKYLKHGQMANRMAWLRHHRELKHPTAFKQSIKRGVAKRKKK